jgi:hypothetical protein
MSLAMANRTLLTTFGLAEPTTAPASAFLYTSACAAPESRSDLRNLRGHQLTNKNLGDYALGTLRV